MAEYAKAISKLIDELSDLPGIGKKTAGRLAFYLLETEESKALALSDAIKEARESIIFCSNCFNLTDLDPCRLCRSVSRDRQKICITESPADVAAFERTGSYNGLYHVLHGVISPKQGRVGFESLHLSELLERLAAIEEEENCEPEDIEIILATNPNTYGELTANFIAKFLAPYGFYCTRISTGLPAGGYVDYADQMSLVKALTLRQAMTSEDKSEGDEGDE